VHHLELGLGEMFAGKWGVYRTMKKHPAEHETPERRPIKLLLPHKDIADII
jgi:hypothetical protein